MKVTLKTKQDLQALAIRLTEPLKPHFTPGCAGMQLGHAAAHYSPVGMTIEALLRPLFGLIPLTVGGGKTDLWPRYREGVIHGTDPGHAEYWGPVPSGDQIMVEMTLLGLALAMVPEQLWESLSQGQRDNLVNWLNQVNQCDLPANNWLFFQVFVNLGLRKVGARYSPEVMEAALDKIENSTLTDGWYSDGPTLQRDYYIPFAMHFYGLMYSVFMKEEDSRRSEIYRERARLFATDFLAWFAQDGSALPFGRSLTYRFAMVAFWSAMAYAGVEAVSWGVMKGLVLRHLRWWMDQPILDAEGILTVGYCYPNLKMAEFYNGPGGPAWAMKAFLPLALADDHPFWTAAEEPLPSIPEVVTQKHPFMVLCRESDRDHVFALAGGQFPAWEPTFKAAKYAKFAYSTAFGFSVPAGEWGLEQGAFDSSLALAEDDNYYRPRRNCEEVRVEDACHYSRWKPWHDVEIETWLIPLVPWHVRIHRIVSARTLNASEGGFAIKREFPGSPSADPAMVRNRYGLSGLVNLWGDRLGKIVVAAPNTNLLYPQSLIPSLVGPIQPGETWLACAVLGQPPSSCGEYAWASPPRIIRENGSLIAVDASQRSVPVPFSWSKNSGLGSGCPF